MNSSEFLRLYEQYQIRHEAEMWAEILKSERKSFWTRSVAAIRNLFLQGKNK